MPGSSQRSLKLERVRQILEIGFPIEGISCPASSLQTFQTFDVYARRQGSSLRDTDICTIESPGVLGSTVRCCGGHG